MHKLWLGKEWETPFFQVKGKSFWVIWYKLTYFHAVPCYKRCKDMEHQEENEAIVEPDEDGGWVDTHHNVDPSGSQITSGVQESFAEMTLDSDKVCSTERW